MHSKQYFFDANELLFGANSGFILRDVMSLPGLGLPGLGLEEPSEQPQMTETTQHVLSSGSEWRFEIAFGKFLKVRVSCVFYVCVPIGLIGDIAPPWHS